MRNLLYILLLFVGVCQGQTLQEYEVIRQTQIPVGSSYDTDAQAFIDAVATLTIAQEQAIDDLVVGLKANGTWSKYKAIYPFIGGTESSHKWNLKDPRDLDAAFRLTFNGTITHDANGVTGDGSTGYANTHLVPSTELSSVNSSCVGVYSRTTGGDDGSEIGSSDINASNGLYTLMRHSNGFRYCRNSQSVTTSSAYIADTKMYFNNRVNATEMMIVADGVTTNLSSNSYSLNSQPISILAYNNNGTISSYSSRNLGFAIVGDGLTESDLIADNTDIQTFQTALGRQL